MVGSRLSPPARWVGLYSCTAFYRISHFSFNDFYMFMSLGTCTLGKISNSPLLFLHMNLSFTYIYLWTSTDGCYFILIVYLKLSFIYCTDYGLRKVVKYPYKDKKLWMYEEMNGLCCLWKYLEMNLWFTQYVESPWKMYLNMIFKWALRSMIWFIFIKYGNASVWSSYWCFSKPIMRLCWCGKFL